MPFVNPFFPWNQAGKASMRGCRPQIHTAGAFRSMMHNIQLKGIILMISHNQTIEMKKTISRPMNLKIAHLCATLPIGAIEYVSRSPARERIVETLKRMGYEYVSLDLEGYQAGKMNRGLAQRPE
jgi:hypothetical protein